MRFKYPTTLLRGHLNLDYFSEQQKIYLSHTKNIDCILIFKFSLIDLWIMSTVTNNWLPKPTGINAVCELLELSASCDNEKQKEAYGRQKMMEKSEEFAGYCAAVFVETQTKVEVRQRAGLLMKTCFQNSYDFISESIKHWCQGKILQCIVDPDDCIRKTASKIKKEKKTKKTTKKNFDNNWQ
ncbi:hypothetical protein RFI_28905 [Reticulomyxa filosa]|uniref:Uncharacterized protein n=1 Tax=Reticulomyxa filosa TaxID=46433 RepID=X6M4U2_RETFI|nr:hypothetical protein RFI_28905 [Reticulomyxa filosa]|eukprot:ETO08482.1 hypothetical protein RFI_28905 [Reticulomyxa filosa]